jgi:hypothetical protein
MMIEPGGITMAIMTARDDDRRGRGAGAIQKTGDAQSPDS